MGLCGTIYSTIVPGFIEVTASDDPRVYGTFSTEIVQAPAGRGEKHECLLVIKITDQMLATIAQYRGYLNAIPDNSLSLNVDLEKIPGVHLLIDGEVKPINDGTIQHPALEAELATIEIGRDYCSFRFERPDSPGSFPAARDNFELNAILRCVSSPDRAAAMRAYLEVLGASSFKLRLALRQAARLDDLDSGRVLIELGADVNKVLSEISEKSKAATVLRALQRETELGSAAASEDSFRHQTKRL